MEVYVVTDTEAGWDCIRGVYSSIPALVSDWIDEDAFTEEEYNQLGIATVVRWLDDTQYVLHITELQ